MDDASTNVTLNARMDALASQISAIRRRMKSADDRDGTVELWELCRLIERYEALKKRVDAHRKEPPGLLKELKIEFENLADDMSVAVESFIKHIDDSFSRTCP